MDTSNKKNPGSPILEDHRRFPESHGKTTRPPTILTLRLPTKKSLIKLSTSLKFWDAHLNIFLQNFWSFPFKESIIFRWTISTKKLVNQSAGTYTCSTAMTPIDPIGRVHQKIQHFLLSMEMGSLGEEKVRDSKKVTTHPCSTPQGFRGVFQRCVETTLERWLVGLKPNRFDECFSTWPDATSTTTFSQVPVRQKTSWNNF